jgi:Fur family ferric uptake transcriptional regulator
MPSEKRLSSDYTKQKVSMPEIHKAFEDFLMRRELKYTKQRRILVDAIFTKTDHFEVERLISEIYGEGHSISRGTVYSTIKLLGEAQLIHKIHSAHHRVLYEHVYDNAHDHIICLSCDRVIEFDDETIRERQLAICKRFEIKPKSHNLTIYGECTHMETCEFFREKKAALVG